LNTLSQENSTEILIDNITEWIVNDTTYCVVEAIYPNQGKNIIPNGKAILSASGVKSVDILNNVIIGDTIKLFMGFDNALPKITQMVGGVPRIVKDGINYANAGYYEEGGGSTTMFVRGEVKNSPSDGSERAVKNSLGIYTSAP